MIEYYKYSSYVGRAFEIEDFEWQSTTSIDVLPELIGQPMNDLAMCYISTLKPSKLVINRGEIAANSVQGRVHVILGEDNKIQSISQEVVVLLTKEFENGYELACALAEQKNATL